MFLAYFRAFSVRTMENALAKEGRVMSCRLHFQS